jgi:hypothetical protein
VITQAFTATKVPLDRSLTGIEALLERHGVTDQRYTHQKPRSDDPDAPEAVGRLIYEFVWQGRTDADRRGVRLIVSYQPSIWKRRSKYGSQYKAKGVTAAIAARALFWFVKAKFDAIDFGIEEFDVAFMPHLVTELGYTFAEQPGLLAEALVKPTDLLALPPPR